MTIERMDVTEAKRMLREIMRRMGLSPAAAEKRCVEADPKNAATYHEAMQEILQEDEGQEPLKSA